MIFLTLSLSNVDAFFTPFHVTLSGHCQLLYNYFLLIINQNPQHNNYCDRNYHNHRPYDDEVCHRYERQRQRL